MVECGKRARTAECDSWLSRCGASGDALQHYADALAMQVRNKEMSDGEAHRRFAEYKTQFINNNRPSDPATCVRSGNMVNCY
jgi:hypothetical protein